MDQKFDTGISCAASLVAARTVIAVIIVPAVLIEDVAGGAKQQCREARQDQSFHEVSSPITH
jgi:hypothetical protein